MDALATDSQRPFVLTQSCLVELSLFLGFRCGPEQAAECTDDGEIDLRCKIPEGLKMFRSKAVHKLNRRDQASFSCFAADVLKRSISGERVERANDTAMKCDLGNKVCKVQIALMGLDVYYKKSHVWMYITCGR